MEQRELTVRAAACVALCVACAACSRAPERDLFKEGEDLYLDQKYADAANVFKQRLIQNPDDAGAHFYLGTCYLYDENKNWLGIAQGELETALSLFERQGKVNPVPRFSPEYFEVICHVNQAKIYLILADELVNNPRKFPGVNARVIVPAILKKSMEQAEQAERVSPGHPDVEALKQLIQQILGRPGPAIRPQADTSPAA